MTALSLGDSGGNGLFKAPLGDVGLDAIAKALLRVLHLYQSVYWRKIEVKCEEIQHTPSENGHCCLFDVLSKGR